MKFMPTWMLWVAAAAVIGLSLAGLAIACLKSRRSSRLYRWKIALLGLLAAMGGGATGGVSCTSCYAPREDAASDVGSEESRETVSEEATEEGTLWPTEEAADAPQEDPAAEPEE